MSNGRPIGARYYQRDENTYKPALRTNSDSPRDEQGHGTHTASTAAGVAAGIARGGSTASRIAMYRVCSPVGCPGSAILAGFDDAIADGVDLISVSLGASAYFRPDFSQDPIAIGAFHAVAKGITVVCSAGNHDGPAAGTVVNAAPWILTVVATTIDRDFESDIALSGNNTAVKDGEAINFSSLGKFPVHPLIYRGLATSNSSSDDSASHCEPDSVDGNKIKGKIVLCKQSRNDTVKEGKVEGLKSSGAIGAILVNDLQTAVAATYISFPVTEITWHGGDEILRYINTTKNPVAIILPTITVTNILKPDIGAPGANILAAWIPDSESEVPKGQKPSKFNLVSGTSMACPHVAGIAATIKAWNPTWSPSAIRSAVMTTATQANNDHAPITNDSGSTATPYDYGAGEVSPTGALQPGLVYEAGTSDYLLFLCNYGYQTSTIQLITSIPDGFECPKNSSKGLNSNLNYPSIAVSKPNVNERKTVSRIVTNVGAEETTYVVSINSPAELDLKSLKGDVFGSVTWSDGTHRVRSPL